MAKIFSFRLEKILNLRTQKVAEYKEELNRILAQRYLKEAEIEDKVNYLKILLKAAKGKIKASVVQAQYNHIAFVEEEILNLKNEKEQLLEIENLRRAKLTEAMKEEKILEKLKEKKKFIHLEEVRKEEEKLMDEVAQNRFIKGESMSRKELYA